jgi:hypothetical protein
VDAEGVDQVGPVSGAGAENFPRSLANLSGAGRNRWVMDDNGLIAAPPCST